MLKIITTITVFFFATVSFAQNFEGKIVYENTYTSKVPGITDGQFAAMLGSVQEYYIKDGDYKSVANGTFFQWQLYVNKDNKLYTKMINAEALLWNDGASNSDEVLKTEINKNAVEVLGYKCDELILTCKSGTQKYYFNTTLSVDKKLFANHKYGNWFAFLSSSNALPLKSIIESKEFTLESIATEVSPLKLEKALFELPANAKTIKSPF